MVITVESPKDNKNIDILYEDHDTTGLNALFVDTESIYLVFGKTTLSFSPSEFMEAFGVLVANINNITSHFDTVPHVTKGDTHGDKN